MPHTLALTILFGSYRQDRTGIRAVRFIMQQLQNRGHEVEVVDAQECNLPMLDRMYKEYPSGEAPEVMERLATRYRSTDGFVIVTGEYNHGLQPGLKNLLDHYLEEYFFRPSAIVSYSAGTFAGARAAVHLREVASELGMPSIPSVFGIGTIQKTLTEQGEDAQGVLTPRVGKFLNELEWYAHALKQARLAGTPY